WAHLRKEACLARCQATPPSWALQRGQCLDETRLFLKKLAHSYLEASPAQVVHARTPAAALTARIQRCAHVGPATPSSLPPAVDAHLQDALVEAEVEEATGRLARAEEAARRAVRLAEQLNLDVARAEAHHRLGRILGHRRRTRPALEHLQTASRAAM